MSETDLSNYKDDRERSESELDEGDRLKPEFVRAVLDAVEEGDAEAAYDRVEPLHPADIADLIELTDDDRAALYGAFLTVAAKLRGPDGAQALVLFRRKGKRAFEAEKQG